MVSKLLDALEELNISPERNTKWSFWHTYLQCLNYQTTANIQPDTAMRKFIQRTSTSGCLNPVCTKGLQHSVTDRLAVSLDPSSGIICQTILGTVHRFRVSDQNLNAIFSIELRIWLFVSFVVIVRIFFVQFFCIYECAKFNFIKHKTKLSLLPTLMIE